MANIVSIAAVALIANIFYSKEGLTVAFANTSEAQASAAYLFGILLIALFIVGVFRYVFGIGGGEGDHGH